MDAAEVFAPVVSRMCTLASPRNWAERQVALRPAIC